MQSRNLKVALIAFLLVFVSLSILPMLTLAQDDEESPRASIVLADIDSDPAKKIKRFQPLADYLAAHLSDYGIETGEVKVAPDMETLIEWIESGEIDMYFDSAYPVMRIASEAGARPILRRWKGGVEEYHSVFFALADSGFETVEDLQGQMVAFDAPFSTSGYMLPMAYLLENDLVAVQVDRDEVEPEVADDEIGYIFSEDDETTVQWVISGRTAAGVVDSETFLEIPEETRQHMVILAETVAVPRHIAVVSAEMDPELVDAVTALLLGLAENEEGLAVLEAFEDTSKFDEFPQGVEEALEELQAMFDLVRQSGEE